MEEILEKLLSSELLAEETKNEITEAWTEAVAATRQEIREEVTLEVRAELAEQFIAAREALVEKTEKFISEQLEAELADLKGDIERFRDLEAEFAGKLVEEKQRLAEEVEKELDALVDKLDSFLEIRLAEEIEEMKEDLEIVKENQFGRKVFEAFVSEFSKSYVDEDSIMTKLSAAESKLADAEARLAESEEAKSQLVREQKLEQVLKPLAGSKREQMAIVLQNVETEKLDEAYNYFIGRILREETDAAVATKPIIKEVKVEQEQKTTLATGDIVKEGTEEQVSDKKTADLSQIKRIAGLSS